MSDDMEELVDELVEVHTIEITPGNNLYGAMLATHKEAETLNRPVQVEFNTWKLVAYPTDTLEQTKANWSKVVGFPILTNEESLAIMQQEQEEREAAYAKALAETGAMSETEMRDADVPWPESMEDLTKYVDSLVNRPHDYGTCVYAMSMAAEAAYQYVAKQLGVSGFQAGMADLDFVRRRRDLKGAFRLNDYSNLLYPQYIDREHFPTAIDVLDEQKEWLQEEAQKKLDNGQSMHPDVVQHLAWLKAGQPDDWYAAKVRSGYEQHER